MDTPLAESAIVGCAIGAAVEGLRPIAEMQFSDFISCGFDQLVNVAGKMYYRMGLSVNITVRLPYGGGFSGGPYHSQNPEAWFMHAPGLKVVAPSHGRGRQGPADLARCATPTRCSSWSTSTSTAASRATSPDGAYETPFTARIAREGTDLDRDRLRRDGPHRARGDGGPRRRLDRGARPALARAARRGGDPRVRCARRSKVVIVDEANQTCAAGAQVAALIAERAGRTSTARSCASPRPTCRSRSRPPLEQAVLPQVDDVREACRELLDY